MSSGLNFFLERLPDWLELIDKTDLPASALVRTDRIGPAVGRVDLLLKQVSQEPCVEELDSETKQLPDFCFERHIMPDRSFCLGHIEGTSNQDNVDAFWRKLGAFLKNQDYAARHGVWPIEQGMSHSETSMRAQKLIEDMIRSDEGLLQEWLLSAFRGRGWISEVAHRRQDKPELTLTKRQACPRGCSKLNPSHAGCKLGPSKNIPRAGKKDCAVLIGDCKDAEFISDILMLEHIRFSSDRLLHEAIIQSPQEGIVCCGSMKTCPMNAGA